MSPDPDGDGRRVAHRGHVFTRTEWLAMTALRERYQRDNDVLSEAEQNRLRWWRWMYRVGWLPSSP